MKQRPIDQFDGQYLSPRDVARLASQVRKSRGHTPEDAADRLGVDARKVEQAENQPSRGLIRLRRRLIEQYTGYTIQGPFYKVHKRRRR